MQRTAVVTGGGSGIGRACARRLAADGLQVAVWDLNEANAQAVAAEITAAGGQAIASKVDVAQRADITAALAAAHARFGPVTVIVTSAGITGFDEFMTITEAHWDRMMAVNLKGTFLSVQAVIPDMLVARWGRVINISSSSTQSGAARMVHYVASKGGVVGLTRALAIEFAASGITVNHVPPGFINTPMQQKAFADGHMNLAEREAAMPMKRQGRPEEIAAAVAYLASDDAGYVTGHTLSVNGGRYLL
jgi:2-hydroxycyclohexanecarboxyl-CoA dehydrogenase